MKNNNVVIQTLMIKHQATVPSFVRVNKHYKGSELDVIEYIFPRHVFPKYIRQLKGMIIQKFAAEYRNIGKVLNVELTGNDVLGYTISVSSLWKRKFNPDMFPPSRYTRNTGDSEREWLRATQDYWEQGHGKKLAENWVVNPRIEKKLTLDNPSNQTVVEPEIVPSAVKELPSLLVEA